MLTPPDFDAPLPSWSPSLSTGAADGWTGWEGCGGAAARVVCIIWAMPAEKGLIAFTGVVLF
jgi:hypothetical protein